MNINWYHSKHCKQKYVIAIKVQSAAEKNMM